MPHADLLAMLLPVVSYNTGGQHLKGSIAMEGRELDRLQLDSVKAIGAIQPFTYQQWIEDWERVYGLPDECSRIDQLYQERLQLLAIAFMERGGISISWIKRYAQLSGYEVSVNEYQQFRAGISRAGDALTNGDWLYAFRVVAQGEQPLPFRAGQSQAGDPLRLWGDSILNCVIQQRKPAHTVALIAYLEE